MNPEEKLERFIIRASDFNHLILFSIYNLQFNFSNFWSGERTSVSIRFKVLSMFRRNHVFEVVEPWGNMQAVVWDAHEARLDAASDPRGIGSAKVETLYVSD